MRLSKNGNLGEYSLNWAEASNYSYKGWDYLRVPFGSLADSSLGMGYHIVFRRLGPQGAILANYKQYARLHKSADPAGFVYAENIYGLQGHLLVAVGHEGGRRWRIDTVGVSKASHATLAITCTVSGYSYTVVTCVGPGYDITCTFTNHSSYSIYCTGDPGAPYEGFEPPDGGGYVRSSAAARPLCGGAAFCRRHG